MRVPLAAVALAFALSAGHSARAQDPVAVLATVGMIADLASDIGAECAQVEALVPAGADPHLFRPRPSDLSRLQQAQVIFHLGLNLEGRLGDVLGTLSRSKTVVELGAAIPGARLLQENGAPDPHIWMEPALWAGIIPGIAQTLGAARPDCAEGIAARAEGVALRLTALDDWLRASMATIPAPQRVLVTAHDAFGYFSRAYGLEQAAIQGFSTESEASVADIRSVARMVHRQQVPAVFVETTINPRSITALREAVAALGGSVDLGAPLFSDAMGDPGTPEGTYIGMIRANGLAIAQGLGGRPAPWPDALADWAATWKLTQ